MSEPRNSWKSREFCREAEIRAVENALKLLRADDRRYKEAPSWDDLARGALVRSRALTLVALRDAMLAANMSEEQVVATLLAAENGDKWSALFGVPGDIRRAIDLRGSDAARLWTKRTRSAARLTG